MLKLYQKNNSPKDISTVVSILKDGGVIIMPTGTTYVLGCMALKERAIERIHKIKKSEPSNHPLSVICYDMSAISEYAHISTPVYKIMKRNLPGPFTFILLGKNKLPKIFKTKKNGEVGIRMPEYPIVRSILKELDAPMMVASLPQNELLEEEYQTDPDLIEEKYGSQVDLVIDGGLGKKGQTTIVDCTNDEIEIVRQGNGVLYQ